MFGEGFFPFNPYDLLAERGLGQIAGMVPLIEGFLCKSGEIYGAFVRLEPDKWCPDGVFELAVAFDTDKDVACARATFEAIERYCLASSGHHSGIRLSRDDPRLYQLHQQIRRLDYPEIVEAIPLFKLSDRTLEKSGWLGAKGDIFAPVRMKPSCGRRIPMTNGSAVQNDLLTAATKARFEVVERDVVMRFWYTEATRKRSVVLPALQPSRPRDFISRFGLRVVDFMIPGDFGIKVVISFAINDANTYPYHLCAAAAATETTSALRSAHLELIQTLFAVSMNEELIRNWHAAGAKVATLEHHMYAHAIGDDGLAANDAIRSLALDQKVPDQDDTHTTDQTYLHRTIYFADITPPALRSKVRAVRAIGSGYLDPLVGSHSYRPKDFTWGEQLSELHPFP